MTSQNTKLFISDRGLVTTLYKSCCLFVCFVLLLPSNSLRRCLKKVNDQRKDKFYKTSNRLVVKRKIYRGPLTVIIIIKINAHNDPIISCGLLNFVFAPCN